MATILTRRFRIIDHHEASIIQPLTNINFHPGGPSRGPATATVDASPTCAPQVHPGREEEWQLLSKPQREPLELGLAEATQLHAGATNGWRSDPW